MGLAKARMMQVEDQGWSFIDDKNVCDRCFVDEALKDFVRGSATAYKCNYCGRKSRKGPIATDINEVLALIGESINTEYGDAADLLPYESAEGGYQGATYDSVDVLEDYEPFTNDDLRDDIVGAFSDRLFCDHYLESETLIYGWNEFVRHIKHRCRYFFSSSPSDSDHYGSGDIRPEEMMGKLGRVVEQVGLIEDLPAGTPFFRARIADAPTRYSTATEIGTPPRDATVYANRMSPAGIPMFYGAGDLRTAIAETYTPKPGRPATISLGRFVTARNMKVVNLLNVPELPSVFDSERRHLRSAIRFLTRFADELSKPINKDGREHIDYVPTQVVTEYFRQVFKTEGEERISGVLYRSTKNKDGICCVLFVENEGCVDITPGWETESKAIMGLDPASVRHVKRK